MQIRRHTCSRYAPIRAALIFLGVALAVAPAVRAAGPGEASFVFLKIGTEARAEALGGAYAALADAVGGLFYNPAGMAWGQERELTATYNNWLADIQSGFIGGVMPVGESGRIGASIQYLDYGTFRGATATGDELPDFGASAFAAAVGHSRRIGERTSIGATARFITESIDGETATALAFDLGVIHRLRDHRTALAATVRNAGTQLSTFKPGASKDKLPTTGVIGLTHNLRGAPVIFVLDLLKPYDNDFGVAAGLEALVGESLRARIGYNTLSSDIETGSDSDNLAGLRLGAGFILEKITIDYSVGLFSELGTNHRFTVRTGVL